MTDTDTAYCVTYWTLSSLYWSATRKGVFNRDEIDLRRENRARHFRSCQICQAHFSAMNELARNAHMPEFEETTE